MKYTDFRIFPIAFTLFFAVNLFGQTSPRIITMEEISEVVGRAQPAVERNVTLLIFPDGSKVLSQKTKTAASPSGWFELRNIFDYGAGKNIEYYPELQLKMTVPLDNEPSQKDSRRSANGSCLLPKEFRRNQQADLTVGGVLLEASETTIPKESGEIRVMRWLAPELGCMELQKYASLWTKDGEEHSWTKKRLVNIFQATPAETEKQVPVGTKESRPSEVLRQIQAFQGKDCPDCLLNTGIVADQKYDSLRSRKKDSQ